MSSYNIQVEENISFECTICFITINVEEAINIAEPRENGNGFYGLVIQQYHLVIVLNQKDKGLKYYLKNEHSIIMIIDGPDVYTKCQQMF